jgi:YVTN family beta-propeller protein
VPDLPSGAVTFLFTDIEGSTDLVRQLRAGWAGVLSEHQRLLRGAFDAHGGHEIDTQGDSFFYAFPSAHDAVLGAIEAQRALSDHPWPDGAPLKVRMGLHTAQAAPLDGRYTGLAVHRAARISDAGHGGQILVSQATQSLLEDEAEDVAASVRDLGERHLKGIERPVRLYQVVAPGLPTTFPPLRGEEQPSEAPLYRRPPIIVVAVVLVALVAAAAVYAVASRGGDASVSPNSVGVIDPKSGRLVGEVAVGGGPGPVAVGAGAVWVGNLDDRTLTRIDSATRKVVKTIAVQATPTGVTATPGAVWVLHGQLGIVSRVDPQFNRVVATVDPNVGRSSGGGIDAGLSGIWIALAGHAIAFVGRIDPAGNEITTNGYPNGRPTAIAVEADAVWITNGEDSTISRIHPRTGIEVETINVGRRPSAIAVGAGAVWVANAEDDTISRVDPAASSSATIGVDDEPVAIAFGAGSVWVANAGDGTVSQIDPTTSDVTRPIDVGGRPAGLAVGPGGVWVAVQSP